MLIVGGPDDGADALHFAWEGFAGGQVLDVQRVLAEAGGVGGVGQPAAVVGDVGVADGEEGVALGQLVAVQDHLLGCVVRWLRVVLSHPCARPPHGRRPVRGDPGKAQGWGTQRLYFRCSGLAAVDGVLVAFLGAGVVPPVAVAEGDGDVGLLDVAEHLPVEVVAQAGQRGHPGFGVGVFGLQVGGDLGVLLVAQPGVVVAEGHAVQSGLSVLLAGNGGWQGAWLSVISFPVYRLGHPHPAMEPAGPASAYNEER